MRQSDFRLFLSSPISVIPFFLLVLLPAPSPQLAPPRRADSLRRRRMPDFEKEYRAKQSTRSHAMSEFGLASQDRVEWEARRAAAQKQPPNKTNSAMRRQVEAVGGPGPAGGGGRRGACASCTRSSRPFWPSSGRRLESAGVLHEGQLKEEQAGRMRPDAGTRRVIYAAGGKGPRPAFRSAWPPAPFYRARRRCAGRDRRSNFAASN